MKFLRITENSRFQTFTHLFSSLSKKTEYPGAGDAIQPSNYDIVEMFQGLELENCHPLALKTIKMS